jgi:hypothetical protein
VILEFIGCLHAGHTIRVANEPGLDHIGKEHAAQSSIDWCMVGGEHFAHGDLLERLPAAQQFAVDLGDRF